MLLARHEFYDGWYIRTSCRALASGTHGDCACLGQAWIEFSSTVNSAGRWTSIAPQSVFPESGKQFDVWPAAHRELIAAAKQLIDSRRK